MQMPRVFEVRAQDFWVPFYLTSQILGHVFSSADRSRVSVWSDDGSYSFHVAVLHSTLSIYCGLV